MQADSDGAGGPEGNEVHDASSVGPAPGDAASEPARGIVDDALEQAMESWLGWLPDEPWVRSLMALVMLLGIAWLFHLIAKRYVVRMLGGLMKRLPKWWADAAVDNKVFHRLVPLVPVVIIGRGIALAPHLPPGLIELVQRIAQALTVLLITLAIGATLNVVNTIYNRYPIARGRPIKGYLQAAKLVIYILAGILILSALIAESPWVFLTGLGAMMAVILLIFRDTLLSLVAGIQLVNNDLVRVGDWIEMPQFNADGDVIDISLNVVQVRNWDKTITSIPTHKFLDHSFKNWRGMFDLGGRRISRPVYVDMTTIRFLTEDEVKRFSRFRLLHEYIAGKVRELDEHNRKHCADQDTKIIANARCMTNIGTFRAYIFEYLKSHPMVHPEYTTMVRQLEPGPSGLPLQIWTFVKDTRWVVYEGVQSDIFDHILAIAPEFGLRIFQEPTGHDIAQIGAARRAPRAASD